MKKNISYPFAPLSFFISGMAVIAISFSVFSFASEVDPDQGLEEEMEDPVALGGITEEYSNLDGTEGIARSCFDDFANWPHSGDYNEEVLWSMNFLPFEAWTSVHHHPQNPHQPYTAFANPDPRREWMIDINGDGLLDYVYVYRSSGTRRVVRECVYINNGKGWDPVYRCHGSVGYNQNQRRYVGYYYGDCASEEDE